MGCPGPEGFDTPVCLYVGTLHPAGNELSSLPFPTDKPFIS